MAFLDLDGLSHLVQWFKGQLGGKVDKVSGKQLSTNDYTTAEKNKLAGLSNYSHPTSSGNKHIPAGGAAGQILRWSADGTATWGPDNNTTYSAFKGATSSAAGGGGLVPAPGTADVGKVLKGSGTWGTLGKSDVGLDNVDNTADSAKSVKYATSAGSAGSAGSATNDSKKQAITGYIRGLSVSGRTVTYTRGDGTTGSITTQDTNTTYGNSTKSSSGLMSSSDKSKLDGIATGANKTVVDGSLSATSTNPVQNAVVTKGMQYLYKCAISRDAWGEASDKSNWNVIANVTKPTTAISGIPDLTTDMKLSPPMMERAASIADNKILTGELSMINCGNISINDTNKISLIIERRPVCDVVLYFYGRK